jgi:hypothetical protein
MNRGKSSNCVHWLYAVETGTATSIDSVIVRGAGDPPVSGAASGARNLRPSWEDDIRSRRRSGVRWPKIRL